MEVTEYSDEKATIAYRKFKVGKLTLERWEKNGFIPAKYFPAIQKQAFRIGDKTLLELRMQYFKTQNDFLIQFNQKYGLEVSQVLLSNWERGKATPRLFYQKLLKEFLVN